MDGSGTVNIRAVSNEDDSVSVVVEEDGKQYTLNGVGTVEIISKPEDWEYPDNMNAAIITPHVSAEYHMTLTVTSSTMRIEAIK
jgi:hypothetical protein